MKKISIAVSVVLITGCSHPTYMAQPYSSYTAPKSSPAVKSEFEELQDGLRSTINTSKAKLIDSQSLSPKAKELVNNVCKNEDPASLSKDARKCNIISQVITHSLVLEEVLKNAPKSKNDVDAIAVNAFSELGTMYSTVWYASIEDDAIADVYGRERAGTNIKSLDAERERKKQRYLSPSETLELASTTLVKLDIPQKTLIFENNLQKIAKKSGKKEFLDFAVKFHTFVDLNLNPRGSLNEYKKQLQDATTKLEEAKTLLSLTK